MLAFRVPIPMEFITTLRTLHLILPKRNAKSVQRGTHNTPHYALWGDCDALTPYVSQEFIKDGNTSTEWAKVNQPLFLYLADEMRFRDPEIFFKI